jgi:hypothetical protein
VFTENGGNVVLSIDLSFNSLGPTVPFVFFNHNFQTSDIAFSMRGCGITSVQSMAFNQSLFSLMDLRSVRTAGKCAAQAFRFTWQGRVK